MTITETNDVETFARLRRALARLGSALIEHKHRPDQARDDHGRFADEGRGSVHERRRRLGDLSATFESSGLGPGTVSEDKHDPGGVSYGSYQLATNKNQPAKFLFAEGARWADEFGGQRPGTPEFTQTWQTIAAREPAAFEQAQYDFIVRTHYEPQVALIARATNLDINSHSEALKEVVFSTAVQSGPHTPIVVNAVRRAGSSAGEALDAYDAEVINYVYDARFAQSPKQARRYREERAAALKLLFGRQRGLRVKKALVVLSIDLLLPSLALAASIDGFYVRPRPYYAQMQVVSAPGGLVRVYMTNLEDHPNGAVLLGGCQAVGQGRVEAGVLAAKAIPVTTSGLSVSAKDIAEMFWSGITIRFTRRGADVLKFWEDCGTDGELAGGRYRKVARSQLRGGLGDRATDYVFGPGHAGEPPWPGAVAAASGARAQAARAASRP